MEKGQPRQGGQLSAVKFLPNSLQTSSKIQLGSLEVGNTKKRSDFFHTGLGAAFSSQGVIRGELMSSYERRLKVCWERGGRAADAGVVEFVAQSPHDCSFKTGVGGSQDLGLLDTSAYLALPSSVPGKSKGLSVL